MDLSPLFISLKVALFATCITFVLGLLAAWLLAKDENPKRRIIKGVLDGLFTLPMVLPPTVVGFFLLLLFGRNGLLGELLEKAAISVVFTLKGAVLAAAVVSFPLMYRTSRGAFEQLDKTLVYAGRTLGMAEYKIFFKIILPSCWPGVIAGTVLAFARSLGEFGATAMVAGNIPNRTQTMALAIYSAVAGGNREAVYLWVGVTMLLSFTSLMLINALTGRRKNQEAQK